MGRNGKGLFISIEGTDGSGKSTQIANIERYMKEKGIDAIFTREPGGTVIGEKIREIILNPEHVEMSDTAEALLYAAARAQHVAQVIRPALQDGRTVVCDRFVDSSIAYQGYGRQLGDGVRVINDYAIDECLPDCTIYLDLDPVIGKSRIQTTRDENLDRLEIEKDDFHMRVYNGYKEIMALNRDRFRDIDASGTADEVKEAIYKVLDDLFGKEQ